MPKGFYKHKLLLDENMPPRHYLPLLNNRYDIKHIAADYKSSGLSDKAVLHRAVKEMRIVITYNVKDFKKFVLLNTSPGVIGISPNLPIDQVDKKLSSLLTKSSKKSLFGKFITIV